MVTVLSSFETPVNIVDVLKGNIIYRESAVSAIVRSKVQGEAFTLAQRVTNGGTFHYHGAYAIVDCIAYQKMGGTSLGFNGGTFYRAVAFVDRGRWTFVEGSIKTDGNVGAEFAATPVAQVTMLAYHLGGIDGAPMVGKVWDGAERIENVLSARGRLVTNPDGIEGIRDREDGYVGMPAAARGRR